MIAANNLAYLYAEANENLDRALILAQTAVEQAPDNPDVRDTLGWVYYQKQLPDLALRAFEDSIAKNPNNPIYHYHLGLASAKQGEPRTRAAVIPSGAEAQAGLPGRSAGVEDDRWLRACRLPPA